MIPMPWDIPLKTVHGIDSLSLCVRFMGILEGGKKTNANYDRLKSFIVSQIKRGITTQEEYDLVQGILKYLQSTPETNERLEAMDYLFNAKFLTK